ncbi:MAG: hypothetical protein IM607_14290 [Cytophagales bacterium]|nr:hypothetical protein [Cytophagales bacterium]
MDLSQFSDEELMRAIGGGVGKAPAAAMDLSQFSDEELMRAAGMDTAAPVQPETAPKDFLQRVGDDLDERRAKIENIRIRQKLWQPYTEQAKPNEYRGQGLNDISGALQQLGQYAGGGYDILGQGALSLYNAIPESVKDNAVTRAIGQTATTNLVPGLESVTGIKTSPADIASTIGSGVEAARQYAPDAVANIEAAANIIPVAQASGAVMRGAGKAAVRGAENLATPARVMPNSEQLASMGVKGYEAARASGEVFDAPSVTNKFIAAIDSAKPKMIAGAVETDLSRSLESNLGEYRKLLDKPLSIDEVDIIDKDLSNLKDQAYKSGKNQLASELSNIQNTLRGSVADSPSGETLAQARDLYRRKYQMEDVERIFRNAEGRPNEATIIQTGYRNLANQARKKGSGYTKEQIALMDKAAKGGLSIDALKLLSSKLIPIVAGASGNVVGAGAAYMGNLAAGAGATALQTAKANKLAQSITKGITVESEPTLINRLAQRLTKADLQAAFEARKGNK